jgi:hypothetical protein
MFAMNGMLDSIAEDRASGQGEALDAQAVLLAHSCAYRYPSVCMESRNFSFVRSLKSGFTVNTKCHHASVERLLEGSKTAKVFSGE